MKFSPLSWLQKKSSLYCKHHSETVNRCGSLFYYQRAQNQSRLCGIFFAYCLVSRYDRLCRAALCWPLLFERYFHPCVVCHHSVEGMLVGIKTYQRENDHEHSEQKCAFSTCMSKPRHPLHSTLTCVWLCQTSKAQYSNFQLSSFYKTRLSHA